VERQAPRGPEGVTDEFRLARLSTQGEVQTRRIQSEVSRAAARVHRNGRRERAAAEGRSRQGGYTTIATSAGLTVKQVRAILSG
jgi:hypothetical protein